MCNIHCGVALNWILTGGTSNFVVIVFWYCQRSNGRFGLCLF